MIELFSLAMVSLLAAISPGPDFFIVLRNSLVYSRKHGIFTSLGVAVALFAHLSYSVVGIGVLLAESPFIYSLIKYIGAAYLLYIGGKGIIASFKTDASAASYTKSTILPSLKTSFLQGFFTNLLNPKCALFFISLFSQFITPDTTLSQKIAFGAINWSITLAWFVTLSYLLTTSSLFAILTRFRSTVDRVMGSALLLLGARLLFV